MVYYIGRNDDTDLMTYPNRQQILSSAMSIIVGGCLFVLVEEAEAEAHEHVCS